ncbi:hypothetical protein [Rhizomonospora bruguierae]|uniref:hypothetical protein n=1 Tax=Rhizomonospora bruguierae TaxID=1581705 RepID=UPI001BD0C868|nr:hypothetical protein [Micromonospora sp. NBRC 107566]
MAEADVSGKLHDSGGTAVAATGSAAHDRPLWTTAGGPDDGWLLSRPAPTPSRAPRPPRRPVFGLPATVVFALLAAFFGWVSAEPLWLALGHAERGTATVIRCAGDGVTERCVGDFSAPGFTAEGVALLNLPPGEHGADSRVPALMVSPGSSRAYAGAEVTAGVHVRWAVGLALTLLCGLGIAWATGARRLDPARARHLAVLLSLAAPLALAATFLALAF